MENTDKTICRMTSWLLSQWGVRDAVLCPGSRNVPLIMAISRNGDIRQRTVVDERSAAFAALGLAVQTQRPVAVVCTSGTAVLDMAPAVAEAFYRHVPLIVISADRPERWIDQADSQTIRQPGALANIVKTTVDLRDDDSRDNLQFANRKLNDALWQANSGSKGTVHINIQLDVPLTRQTTVSDDESFGRITVECPAPVMTTAQARALGSLLAPPAKVLVVCGGMEPDQRVSRALGRLAAIPNVVVMAEAQANVHAPGVINDIDAALSGIVNGERAAALAPDCLITVGGALVSRFIKPWLRGRAGVRHWQVGLSDRAEDTFLNLERRIMMPADHFLPQLASAMQIYKNSAESDYARRWRDIAYNVQATRQAAVQTMPFCDLYAVLTLLNSVPARWNVQLSNGMSIRYAQSADTQRLHRVDCNRGVSGIDGSTSTAVGAAWGYGDTTLLVTGDMSAQYDIGALGMPGIPASFRMAVLSNGGGNIFRYLKPIAALPECEPCMAAGTELPLKTLAEAYGFTYLEATDKDSLAKALTLFTKPSDRPMILNIITDGQLSADVYHRYLGE